jgi:hypothetical protein
MSTLLRESDKANSPTDSDSDKFLSKRIRNNSSLSSTHDETLENEEIIQNVF